MYPFLRILIRIGEDKRMLLSTSLLYRIMRIIMTILTWIYISRNNFNENKDQDLNNFNEDMHHVFKNINEYDFSIWTLWKSLGGRTKFNYNSSGSRVQSMNIL